MPKSHSGTIFNRSQSAIGRLVEKIDTLRELKTERQRLLLLKNKPWSRIRALTDQIYNIECQDELDHNSTKVRAISENELGTLWTF